MFRSGLILIIFAFISACTTGGGGGVALGPDGKPLLRLYRIHEKDTGRIQFAMMDGINSLRAIKGLSAVTLNPALNAAAATHARDMAVQNRPWHFGSDGSSPIDRMQRVGYAGLLVGETISETYESELETLAAWMETPATRNIILDVRATEIGLGWFQEEKGKIWWNLVMGAVATPDEEVTVAELVE